MLRLLRSAAAVLATIVEPGAAVRRSERDRRTVANYEASIMRILRESEAVSLSALVDRVADEMLLAEQRRGGWVSDIAIWGPALYRREAVEAIGRMLGHSLVLEGEVDGPWLAVPVARPSLIAA